MMQKRCYVLVADPVNQSPDFLIEIDTGGSGCL